MECKNYQFENDICQEISSLSKLDNWHCFLALLEDYVIIFLMAATCSVSWYLYPVAVLIIGSRQRALATLLHEASHKSLAKNKLLNFAIGTFFSGYFVLQTMGSYRESHVRFHHGHFGNIELDPDYKFAIEAGWYARPQSVEKFTLHNIVLPFLLAILHITPDCAFKPKVSILSIALGLIKKAQFLTVQSIRIAGKL